MNPSRRRKPTTTPGWLLALVALGIALFALGAFLVWLEGLERASQWAGVIAVPISLIMLALALVQLGQHQAIPEDVLTLQAPIRSWVAMGAIVLVAGGGGWFLRGSSVGPPPTTTTTPPTTNPEPPPLAEWYDFEGVTIRIGSKEFTEQHVLGEIASQVLDAAGANVTEHFNLGGTEVLREALDKGQIDGYFGYTGTAWHVIFDEPTRIKESGKLLNLVRERDKKPIPGEKGSYIWLRHTAKASSSYAIATTRKMAQASGFNKLSDYARLVRNTPHAATLCAPGEFASRPDGLPGIEQDYKFSLPRQEVKVLHPDRVAETLSAGATCEFGVVFTTSGDIGSNKLVALQDDLSSFPLYNIAMVLRNSIYDQGQGAKAQPGDFDKLFGEVAERLTQERLRELNAEAADGDPKTAEGAVGEFLEEAGII